MELFLDEHELKLGQNALAHTVKMIAVKPSASISIFWEDYINLHGTTVAGSEFKRFFDQEAKGKVASANSVNEGLDERTDTNTRQIP